MPRRRLISDEIITNRGFNELSIEAQAMWVRMLAKSDDFGVLPADLYELNVLLNVPDSLRPKLGALISEYINAEMGRIIEREGRQFFVFKPATFQRNQSFINGKRTKSEYMRLKKVDFEAEIETLFNFQNIPEIPGIPMQDAKSASRTVESREQKEESREQEAESVATSATSTITFGMILKLWRDIRGEELTQHFKTQASSLCTAEGYTLRQVYEAVMSAGNYGTRASPQFIRDILTGKFKPIVSAEAIKDRMRGEQKVQSIPFADNSEYLRRLALYGNPQTEA